MAISSDDPEGKSRLAVFVQGLQKFGWTEGSNIHIEARFSGDDADLCRRYAEELVALAPDVLFASTSESVAAFQRVTRSVPIVFASVIDPVGAGFVRSMARPGGNTTGFVLFEYSISGKWLELLKVSRHKRRASPSFAIPASRLALDNLLRIRSAASSSTFRVRNQSWVLARRPAQPANG